MKVDQEGWIDQVIDNAKEVNFKISYNMKLSQSG